METVRAKMQADLRAAMKSRDAVRVSTLRSAIAALSNAEAVVVSSHSPVPVAAGTAEVARRELTDDDVRGVLGREADELRSAAGELRRGGLAAEAAELEARAKMLESYI